MVVSESYTLEELQILKSEELADILKNKGYKKYSTLKKQERIDKILMLQNEDDTEYLNNVEFSKTQLSAILKRYGVKFKSTYKKQDLLLLVQKENIPLNNGKEINTLSKQYVKDTSKIYDIDNLIDYTHLTCLDINIIKDYIDKMKHNMNKCESGNATYINPGIKYQAPIYTVSKINNDYLIVIEDNVYLVNGSNDMNFTNLILMRYDSDGYHTLSKEDIDICLRNNFIPKQPDSLIQEDKKNIEQDLTPILEIHGYTIEDCL